MVTNRKIRVGIIGANPSRGFASIAHIPALQALADFEISAVCDRVEEKRRQSLVVQSAPAVTAFTRSRRPNKEQPATEPAAVATAKEGVSAATKRLCETDHAGSVEHPAGFGGAPSTEQIL
jgi:predicted dehydrogenase